MRRIAVMPACTPRCPSCIVCKPARAPASLDPVVRAAPSGEVLLCGGDPIRWPHLEAFIAARSGEGRVWLEAPARALTETALGRASRAGVHGISVIIEGYGDAMLRALGCGDGEQALLAAEAHGLATSARLCVRPKTFPIVAPLARRLAPRPVLLELIRQDWNAPPVRIQPSRISKLLFACPNVVFAGDRVAAQGYLPPCTLPEVWTARPAAFQTTLFEPAERNKTLPACSSCDLAPRCRFTDAEALEPAVLSAVGPLREQKRRRELPVPGAVAARSEVICSAPWTTMEVVDPNGLVRQCCSTWTIGERGSVATSTLTEIWNGAGYRHARRVMARRETESLCNPICSRLHDRRFASTNFKILEGSEPFVRNQLVVAEEIAYRREVLRGMPTLLAICPSTYCNYDCIMCDYGRTPRRELPESIWEELPELMPTLRTLTLLGGEPLANPLAMRFLREFDADRWPDAAVDFVTNGSLLGDAALQHMRRCTLGDVTISLNAGTAEAYEAVQRGIPFEEVIKNLDALLRFRAQQPRWFGITVSFVVQPTSAHTLIPFGQLAAERGLRMRLLALNTERVPELDFYEDPDRVARVVEHVDQFRAFADRVRPDWLEEIDAARAAVVAHAGRMQERNVVRLPVVPR